MTPDDNNNNDIVQGDGDDGRVKIILGVDSFALNTSRIGPNGKEIAEDELSPVTKFVDEHITQKKLEALQIWLLNSTDSPLKEDEKKEVSNLNVSQLRGVFEQGSQLEKYKKGTDAANNDPEFINECRKIERTGNQELHKKFPELTDIIWEPGGQNREGNSQRVKEYKDDAGEVVAKITETTHRNVKLANGETAKSAREINIPLEISENTGDTHFTFTSLRLDGKTMDKPEITTYFGYKDGKLIHANFPTGTEYNKDNLKALACFKVNGETYSTGFTGEQILAIKKEIAKNKGVVEGLEFGSHDTASIGSTRRDIQQQDQTIIQNNSVEEDKVLSGKVNQFEIMQQRKLEQLQTTQPLFEQIQTITPAPTLHKATITDPKTETNKDDKNLASQDKLPEGLEAYLNIQKNRVEEHNHDPQSPLRQKIEANREQPQQQQNKSNLLKATQDVANSLSNLIDTAAPTTKNQSTQTESVKNSTSQNTPTNNNINTSLNTQDQSPKTTAKIDAKVKAKNTGNQVDAATDNFNAHKQVGPMVNNETKKTTTQPTMPDGPQNISPKIGEDRAPNAHEKADTKTQITTAQNKDNNNIEVQDYNRYRSNSSTSITTSKKSIPQGNIVNSSVENMRHKFEGQTPPTSTPPPKLAPGTSRGTGRNG